VNRKVGGKKPREKKKDPHLKEKKGGDGTPLGGQNTGADWLPRGKVVAKGKVLGREVPHSKMVRPPVRRQKWAQ